LVVYMGSRLVWARWRILRKEDHHHPDHSHAHPHNHDHPHTLPESIKMSELLTLGISGGLLPCPEALGIMLIAIGLNRIFLGLGLIVAFSFGLAAVLMIIGILLVRSKALLERLSHVRGLARWETLLPLASAVIVTLLGLGIVVKGLLSYLTR
jgi:nickel/cobalt transporter (NicO) family protein